MRTLWLLPLLLLLVPSSQNQNSVLSKGDSPVAVLSFEWSKTRLTVEQATATTGPAAAMIPANKNFERNRRANTSPGERDPNSDTIDGRSAALERSVQEARAPKPIDGFAYRVKMRNASTKVIETLIWEYQFKESANPTNISRRQFLCGVTIKPNQGQDFRVLSKSGPSNVVSVNSLGSKSKNLFDESVLINRVEFTDGTFWQRQGWDAEEAKRIFESRTAHERVSAMCISL